MPDRSPSRNCDDLMALYAEAFKAVFPGHVEGEPIVLQVMALREFVARLTPSETGFGEWVPVAKEPPCANWYLGAIKYLDGERVVREHYFSMERKWDSSFITHWMPIPEAPQ